MCKESMLVCFSLELNNFLMLLRMIIFLQNIWFCCLEFLLYHPDFSFIFYRFLFCFWRILKLLNDWNIFVFLVSAQEGQCCYVQKVCFILESKHSYLKRKTLNLVIAHTLIIVIFIWTICAVRCFLQNVFLLL